MTDGGGEPTQKVPALMVLKRRYFKNIFTKDELPNELMN